MIPELTKLQRRWLALAILFAALGAVFALTVLPVWSMNARYEEKILSLEGRLEKLQRAAALSASLKPQYEQLQRRQASDGRYLESPSEALAGAQLQRIVKRIAAAHGTEILSTQILPAQRLQDPTPLTLKVRMRGTLENMTQVFHAIEAGEPFLFLERMSVRNRGGWRARTARRQTSTARLVDTLDVEIELTGYIRSGT